MSKLTIGGRFGVEHYRKGILIARHQFKNGVTIEGLDDLLGVAFRNQTQIPNWYFGLINNAGTPVLSSSDTMASHAGWAESADYDELTRRDWTPSVSGDAKIVNTSYPTFTINTTVTIAGIFIASDDTKSGSSGVLWSTGFFDNGTIALVTADVLKTYYELTAASSLA